MEKLSVSKFFSFIARVIDTSDKPSHSNIFANFCKKIQNGSYRVFRAMGARILAWEKLIGEKTRS
jgi:hypothetical protein